MIRISSPFYTSRTRKSKSSPYDMTLAFVGNPSVGKSAFFSRLTGVGVDISNYPGTTVTLTKGIVKAKGKKIEVVDLPGIYSLGGSNEDEEVTKKFLIQEKPDVIVNVLDASRLERNLFLTLQLLELDIPMVIALNQIDLAEELGTIVDSKKLSELMGLPVVPTVATQGKGLDEVVLVAMEEKGKAQEHYRVMYSQGISEALAGLNRSFPCSSFPCSSPSVKIAALMNDTDFVELCCMPPEANALLNAAQEFRQTLELEQGLQVHDMISRDLFGDAGQIVDQVVHRFEPRKNMKDRIDRFLTSSNFGILVLLGTMLFTFLLVFKIGGFLESWIVDGIFEPHIISPAEKATQDLPYIWRNLIVYSLRGLEAGFAIAIPYIAVFYAILSVFEDSGYLTRAAFLLDNLAHKLGLHGRAIIPLVLGFGCNVPAIMALHAFGTRREKRIASLLISLIPCSARTVIILGLVGTFVGFWAAVSIYFMEIFIIAIMGLVLGKTLSGERSGFIMEMAPLRRPELVSTLKKTWMKSREFVYIAFPLLLVGSAFLGVAEAWGLLSAFQNFVEPVSVGVLGLPAFAVTALVFGILRKEMALQILAVLAGTADFASLMTPLQLYEFAVITTIYVPCVATIAVLKHELGWKDTALIVLFTVFLALGIGILIRYIGPYFF